MILSSDDGGFSFQNERGRGAGMECAANILTLPRAAETGKFAMMPRMPRITPAVAERVIQTLAKRYTAKADMDLGNPKDTLLGVLLSAQTTDKQVLKIFPAFKKKFPTFTSLMKSTPEEIAKSIASLNLYRGKAKAIHGLSRIVMEEHKGKVPSTMEALIRLPGVGRKTANCVLSHVFEQDTVCVDTHVLRIANRLGWTRHKTPDKVENDLKKLVPQRAWREINRVFVQFGRDACKAPTPQCWKCPVRNLCPYQPKTAEPK
jgi:endonuclease III